MKIKTIIETTIEAGDLLEWDSGKDHIVFVVITVNVTNEFNITIPIVGMSIYDNRKIVSGNIHRPHIVNFTNDTNLTLVAKAKNVDSTLIKGVWWA